MGAASCPLCGAYTSTATGYCQVCRQPLRGVTPQPTQAQPSYGYGAPQYAAPGYGAPGYGAPAYGQPQAYAQPSGYYPPQAYAPPPAYGYPYVPVVYVPTMLDEPAVALGKQVGGARWGAAVLDLLIVFGVWIMLALLVYPAMFGGVGFGAQIFVRFMITLLWFYLYYALLDGFTAGGTLGKRAMGIVLVNRQFNRIKPGQAFARAFEFFIWPFGIILILIIQDSMIQSKGQGMGDRLGGTFLVRKSQLAQMGRKV